MEQNFFNHDLFNHNDIFVLLYNGNISGALETFLLKTGRYKISPLTRYSYLSSLNFGIYNYILFKENVSLHKSCEENEKRILKCTDKNIAELGKEIITTYGYDTSYLIEKHTNVHIKNALKYIHAHLDSQLSLSDVSRHICINEAYLCHLFKTQMNTNFCDYILQQRIKLATQLLSNTGNTIQNVAVLCGFKNASYFSTCYKKCTGIKPSDIRRNKPANN